MFFFFYCTTQRVQAAGARHHFLTYFRIWWDTWRLSRDVRAVPDGGAGPFLDAVNRPSLLCLLSSQTARLKGLMNAFVHRTGVRGISPLPENKKTLISKLCNVLLGRTGWLLNQIGKIHSVAEQKKQKHLDASLIPSAPSEANLFKMSFKIFSFTVSNWLVFGWYFNI